MARTHDPHEAWQFDRTGPDSSSLAGPVPLATTGMELPNRPGLYIVTCGDCLAHVGTSGRLASRVRTLASLRSHGGSAEVLCAAFCTGNAPVVWWEELPDVAMARSRELRFKEHYGEPPSSASQARPMQEWRTS
jgi:hypothetical protein